MKTFIIAEAGVNHNGSYETAMKMVDAAANAGVDAIKFQAFKADKIVTCKAPKAKYQIDNMNSDEPQIEMLRKLELSDEANKKIYNYCKEKNIVFLSTPFDEESADFLDNIGMQIFKIPSGEITNKPLIQHIAKKGKDIILSTGMSFLGEVEKAIGWIYETWDKLNSRPKLTLLHCVSDYPAGFEDVNLSVLNTMKTAFGLPVGYSDHTQGIEIPIAAAAIGADVIEKHFTLNKNMEGPDHKASLEPHELYEMVKAIRNVEMAMGDGIKRPAYKEEGIKVLIRRSIVAVRDIKKGEIIEKESIAVKRPGDGIMPEYFDSIVNRPARNDIKKDTLIKWEDL